MKKNETASIPRSAESTDGVLGFHRLSRSLRTAALPSDLTWERLSALSVIVQKEPVSISELSAAEKVTPPTMSRMVSALQSRELVRCVLDDKDKRSVRVISTAKGRTLLRKGLAHSLELIAELLARLEQDALGAMTDLIRASQAGNNSSTQRAPDTSVSD